MTDQKAIERIIIDTYGHGAMPRALAQHLAEKVEKFDGDDEARHAMILGTCWDWFPGGDTAASVTDRIEAALED